MRRKLLVITEFFQVGGLETQIRTQAEGWHAQGLEVFVATQPGHHPELLDLVPASNVLALPMGPSLSARSWLESLETLERWVDAHGIEVVHAHPFVSFFPAFFVSQSRRLPLLISVHGPTLFEPAYGRLFQLFLEQLLWPHAAGILCVSPETAALAATSNQGAQIRVVPNTVNPARFRALPSDPDPLRRWLVVSRLDAAKAEGLRELLRLAQAIGIEELDLVGDGEAHEGLATFCRQSLPRLRVQFLGFRDDLFGLAEQKTYSGVAGMGRVVLEACSMNLPTLLVGYDGVKGLVDPTLFERAAFTNFSGRGLPSLDADGLRGTFEDLRTRPAEYHLGKYLRERWVGPAEVAWRAAFAEAEALPCAKASTLRDLLRLEVDDPRALLQSTRLHDRLLKVLFPDHPLVDLVRDRDREREAILRELALERDQVQRLRHQLAELTGSKSWRLTSPLRQGLRMLRRRKWLPG